MRQSPKGCAFAATARSRLLRRACLDSPSGHEAALAAQSAEVDPIRDVEAVSSGKGEK